MNKIGYVFILLVAGLALLFSGCKQQCELIPYGNYGDSDGPYIPGGDSDWSFTDRDDESGEEEISVDGDTELDASELDGTPSEQGEYEESGEESEGEADSEIEIIEEILTYDGRRSYEFSPFGYWEYWLDKAEGRSSSLSRARLKSDFSDEAEELYYNDGANAMSNPPLKGCQKAKSSTLAIAVYRLFNADGRAANFENSFVVRRESKAGKTLNVEYFRIDLPEKPDSYTFEDVCLLPLQNTASDNQARVQVAWLKKDSEFKSYVVTQTFIASFGILTPDLSAISLESTALIIGGTTERTDLKIIESDNRLFLNAGPSIIKYDFNGILETQYNIVFPIADIVNKDIMHMAISPDGNYISLVSYIKKTGSAHSKLWTLHKTVTPNIIETTHTIASPLDSFKTAFTLESKYAVLNSPHSELSDDFLLMDLKSSFYNIKTIKQAVWGTAAFVGSPEQLFQVYPVSIDAFETTFNRIETRMLSEILEEAENL